MIRIFFIARLVVADTLSPRPAGRQEIAVNAGIYVASGVIGGGDGPPGRPLCDFTFAFFVPVPLFAFYFAPSAPFLRRIDSRISGVSRLKLFRFEFAAFRFSLFVVCLVTARICYSKSVFICVHRWLALSPLKT
jgi:hypothetical protein